MCACGIYSYTRSKFLMVITKLLLLGCYINDPGSAFKVVDMAVIIKMYILKPKMQYKLCLTSESFCIH